MTVAEYYTRPVRRTSSGVILGRPTRVSTITVTPGDTDTIVNIKDGDDTGEILYSIEADNAAGSHSVQFQPPLKFTHQVYVDFVQSGGNSSVQISVIEP